MSSVMKSYSKSYADAGVDITAGYEAVKLMKEHVARTFSGIGNSKLIGGIGGFGGAFAPDMHGISEPVLVSGTDGVGTKLKIAFMLDKHDTVGIDCVAMCVNDVLCCGAKPLFFLDYIAIGKNIPKKVASIVSGVADGCVQSGAALIGGETAEMPGFYGDGEYDIAGFTVGIVDKAKMIDNSRVAAGDAVVALPSSGVHSNGFSLVRKVFNIEKRGLDMYVDELAMTLGEALLTPTRIYVKPVLEMIQKLDVRSLAHITGGGFYENIPRSIPQGLSVRVARKSVRVLPIFDIIARWGKIDERDMFNTFNMGVGMTAVLPAEHANEAVSLLGRHGIDAYVIGDIVHGDGGIEIC